MSVLERALEHQANGEAFALATVVRTISVTAAKAGAKAMITPDGAIEEGWIGGGCARAAVSEGGPAMPSGRPLSARFHRAAGRARRTRRRARTGQGRRALC